MFSPTTEPLRELARAWAAATRPPRLRVTVACLALVGVSALLFARHGTPGARLGAAGAVAAGAALALAWRWTEARRTGAPDALLRGIARRVDSARADRALRALSLIGVTGETAGGASAELARLHVARALAEVPSARILERAARLAGYGTAAALVVGAGAAALAAVNGWSIVEGADVLFARGGVAPVALGWLDDVDLTARPPDYLHDTPVHEIAMTPLALPYGTEVTLRGAPIHPGRRLLLTDGAVEVPFVQDGAGSVVARWRLAQTATLRVVARFGKVVIPESDVLPLQSIADEAPVVRLETAPRQVRLADETEDIPIRYRATDDHGLREVHLVLRSAGREERRVLAHLDGETRTDEGGQLLRLRDPFLRRSHAPVEVTVEAKDNDPLDGPKWGASEAITVIPPDVGEPEAKRLQALRELRDALVDSLAWRLDTRADAAGPGAAARAAHGADERRRAAADERRMAGLLARTYAGVSVPLRARAVLEAQRAKVRKAVDAEARAPGEGVHAATVAATERFVLVTDAVIRGLGTRDARGAAKQLADVADDLASGANMMQADGPDARARGAARMDADTPVLVTGGHIMGALGALGRDLGEIVAADCARVARARGVPDPFHAELAARDLAARLRQPDPSFGSSGGAGRGGGESGGGRGTQGDEDVPDDDVEQALEAARGDLDRLSQDHAGAMGRVEQALAGAESDEERDELRGEARRHAEAIRDAARPLPAVGGGGDSWTSKGAAARELAEQAARALEDARPEEAAQAGRGAVTSLEEARRMLDDARRGGWISGLQDADGDPQQLDDARRKLEGEVRWADEQARRMRQAAASRARGQLERGGQEEDEMASRAHDLAQQGRDRGSLPQEAVESIEDAESAARRAAEALKRGDADQGLERQHEAQRDLDAARDRLQDTEDDADGDRQAPADRGGDRRQAGDRAVEIPQGHKGPEDFRRRVVQGLGQVTSGGLKDAVQRYAEGLLR